MDQSPQAKNGDSSVVPAPAAPSALRRAASVAKHIVMIRLDADTLAWFKAQGPRYQTRINALLREHAEANRTVQTK